VLDLKTARLFVVARVRGRVLEPLDHVIYFQRGHRQVEDPQCEEESRRHILEALGSPELAADHSRPPQHQHYDGDHRLRAEDRHGEGQAENGQLQMLRRPATHLLSGFHLERSALDVVVDGGHQPRHPYAQEHVHRVAPGHVAHAGVGVLVVDGRHFAGESVWNREQLQQHRTTVAAKMSNPL
jgi:hypothetical protein